MKKHLTLLFILCSINLTFSQLSSGFHPSLQIDIPKDFLKLSAEEINAKYTVPNSRPTMVFVSPDKVANITYNYTQNLLPKERVKELKDLLVQQFGAANMQIVSSEIKVLGKNEVVFIEMITPNYAQGSMYNVITATNLEDKMLLISFNCPENLRSTWKAKAYKILESIRIK